MFVRKPMKTLIVMLGGCLLIPAVAGAQVPGGVQMPKVGGAAAPALPSKVDLLGQAQTTVVDLANLKSGGKLPADQAGKVDALLPKAVMVNKELQKSTVEPDKLSKLAKELSDIQKEVASLKAMVK
jgi:hypothetical protein